LFISWGLLGHPCTVAYGHLPAPQRSNLASLLWLAAGWQQRPLFISTWPLCLPGHEATREPVHLLCRAEVAVRSRTTVQRGFPAAGVQFKTRTWTEGMAYVLPHPPCKHKGLSSNPSTSSPAQDPGEFYPWKGPQTHFSLKDLTLKPNVAWHGEARL
jgi:hypothetical protein